MIYDRLSVAEEWEQEGMVPVNVRPKTSSVGGTNSFGVVVLVIDSFDGSMSRALIVDAELTLTLYALVHVANILEGDCLNSALWGRN